jgi:hypothetical protein
MQIRPINPQTWLGALKRQSGDRGHGRPVRTLRVRSTSNDASGAPMHPSDLVAQFRLAWKNLVEVLAAANMTPETSCG